MKNGFSLVEILIVITIIAMLAMAAIGALNPGVLTNRAFDARRKKDIGRIKVALEEYYNDHLCYPSGSDLVAINSDTNCNRSIANFSLNPWPCDPATKAHYKVSVGPGLSCPKWFKVFALLQNKKDSEIPANWDSQIQHVGDPSATFSNGEVNFGSSSGNVTWSERVLGPGCNPAICNSQFLNGDCNSNNSGLGGGCHQSETTRCYMQTGCGNPECEVSSCQ